MPSTTVYPWRRGVDLSHLRFHTSHTELSLPLHLRALVPFPLISQKRGQAEQAVLRFKEVVNLLWRAQPLHLQEGHDLGGNQDASEACLGRLKAR